MYHEENLSRGALIRNHLPFIGPMTPFLEIGANAGHTSYLLCNEFGADGFALDISADALRQGVELTARGAPTRADRSPATRGNCRFATARCRLILTYQTLSQFMDIEACFWKCSGSWRRAGSSCSARSRCGALRCGSIACPTTKR